LDDTERLTSYLDGELDAGERRALEAELASDHALREQLEALRGADQALRALGATELPPGARHRLDARLARVLEEVLSENSEDSAAPPLLAAATADEPPTASEVTDAAGDELALRRRRRVLPAVTGVAAGLVLLAGGLVGLGQLDLVSDDAGTAESADAMMSADDGEEFAPAEAFDADGEALGPVVIDEGRSTSTVELEALPASPELEALAGLALSPEDGAVVAGRYQQLLVGGVLPEATGSVADAEESEESGRSVESAIVTREGRELSSEETADLRRCLATLFKGGEQAIPALVELLEFDGTPAVSVGLVSLDPQSDAFTRIEVWTLERATCQVLRFDQA